MIFKEHSWKFLLLILSSLTLSSVTYSTETTHDFSNTYIISVTRETVDDEDDPKLTLEEQGAVLVH